MWAPTFEVKEEGETVGHHGTLAAHHAVAYEGLRVSAQGLCSLRATPTPTQTPVFVPRMEAGLMPVGGRSQTCSCAVPSLLSRLWEVRRCPLASLAGVTVCMR